MDEMLDKEPAQKPVSASHWDHRTFWCGKASAGLSPHRVLLEGAGCCGEAWGVTTAGKQPGTWHQMNTLKIRISTQRRKPGLPLGAFLVSRPCCAIGGRFLRTSPSSCSRQPTIASKGLAKCFLTNAFVLLNKSPDAVYAVP